MGVGWGDRRTNKQTISGYFRKKKKRIVPFSMKLLLKNYEETTDTQIRKAKRKIGMTK